MSFNPNTRLDPSQVEDRHGRSLLRGPVVATGGGISILLLTASMLLGVNPFEGGRHTPLMMPPALQVLSRPFRNARPDANRRQDCRIVEFVNSIQDYWSEEFQRRGWNYTPARTVLFTGAVQAGCGFATEAQGPFYCPRDQRIYLDLAFFQELQDRFGASGGQFTEGYVVSHEYAHHVQNLMGGLDAGSRSDNRSSIQPISRRIAWPVYGLGTLPRQATCIHQLSQTWLLL